MGDRMPALFFDGNTTRLIICISNGYVPNKCFYTTDELPLKIETKIKINVENSDMIIQINE